MVISIICFLILFMLFMSLFRKDTDVFSPGRLFAMIWLLAIGLADLKLSRYQKEWTLFSWIMILIAAVSFLVGVYIVYVVNSGMPLKKIESTRSIIKSSYLNSKLLFNIILLLFLAYIISYIVSYMTIGFLPALTTVPGASRTNWGIFGFGLFIQAVPSIIFLSVLYLLKGEKNKFKSLIVVVIILASLASYSLLLQRYYLICALIISSLLLYYGSNVFKPRNVLIMVILTFLVFFGMSYIRLSGTIVNYLYYLSDMKYSAGYAIFTEPYMYVSMNLENFANAVNYLDNYTYGVFSMDFVFALTGIKHTLVEYLKLGEFPYMITNNFNTYTMFFVYYRDFGVLGIFIIPLIMGSVIATVYNKMRSNPSLSMVSLYILFAFTIILSFFVPIITFLHFIFNACLIYLSAKIISIRKGSWPVK